MTKTQKINHLIIKLIIFISLLSWINCNNDTHPTSLIQTTQTHIIPNGTYFQYTFTSMKL